MQDRELVDPQHKVVPDLSFVLTVDWSPPETSRTVEPRGGTVRIARRRNYCARLSTLGHHDELVEVQKHPIIFDFLIVEKLLLTYFVRAFKMHLLRWFMQYIFH